MASITYNIGWSSILLAHLISDDHLSTYLPSLSPQKYHGRMLLLCNGTFPIIASIGTNIQYTIRVRTNETHSSKCVVAGKERTKLRVCAGRNGLWPFTISNYL